MAPHTKFYHCTTGKLPHPYCQYPYVVRALMLALCERASGGDEGRPMVLNTKGKLLCLSKVYRRA